VITGVRTWGGGIGRRRNVGLGCFASSVGKLLCANLRNGLGSCVSYTQCSSKSLIGRLRSLQFQRTPKATPEPTQMMFAMYRVAGGSRVR